MVLENILIENYKFQIIYIGFVFEYTNSLDMLNKFQSRNSFTANIKWKIKPLLYKNICFRFLIFDQLKNTAAILTEN